MEASCTVALLRHVIKIAIIFLSRAFMMLLALKGLKVYEIAENTSPLRLLEVRKSLGHEVWRSLPS